MDIYIKPFIKMTSDVKVWEEDYLKDIRLGKGQKKITIESVIIG